MAHLSKSRIMSSLQCHKKLWLEAHRQDLAQITPQMQAAFDTGNLVGDIAVALFGGDQGEYIPYEIGLAEAEQRTRELLDGLFRAPVFEATLKHRGVLVREDVLLPDGDSWRVVEVKASTRLKAEHVQDCAIQAWVHRGAGYPLSGISLAHVNNQFVYAGDGLFEGLLIEVDLTDQVHALQPSVTDWVEAATRTLEGPQPEVPVGQHCFSPYECPYWRHCWPTDTRYPLHGLAGSKKKLGVLAARGYRDIREVPADELETETHLRVHRVTSNGKPEIGPGAGTFIRDLGWPRFYLDFETVGTPIPVWPDTRPYQAVPFQWSCHVEYADGRLEHLEFLDLSGGAPMRACAEQLIDGLGDAGPVLVYTAYEKGVLKGLAERYPDLAERLEQLIERLVDLAPPIREAYYHPDMLGSWSLKAVLPTIAPDLDYGALEGVHEGTEASAAYLEAIRPGTPDARRAEIRAQLLKYCEYDTLAMVRLARFFSAH